MRLDATPTRASRISPRSEGSPEPSTATPLATGHEHPLTRWERVEAASAPAHEINAYRRMKWALLGLREVAPSGVEGIFGRWFYSFVRPGQGVGWERLCWAAEELCYEHERRADGKRSRPSADASRAREFRVTKVYAKVGANVPDIMRYEGICRRRVQRIRKDARSAQQQLAE